MAEGAQPIQPGAVIGGKYLVERVLGQGGMAVVVAARHQALDELVAIKVLLPHRAELPDVRARFAREARAAAKIKSEHVARVSDVGDLEDGTPYMVMEYLDGDDLASVLARRGKLAPTEAVLYALQICDALREAHSLGIIHRDIKPANLFLAKSRGRPPRLKVLDFGISKVEHHDRTRTETKEVLGSPWYMAPEHLQSAHSADARSDIWSLGVILYEFVTGEVPFDGESMTEVIVKVLHEDAFAEGADRPTLPPTLLPIIRRCLAKDPADRYDTIDDLAMALRALERSRSFDVRSSGDLRLTPIPTSIKPVVIAEAVVAEDDGEVVDVRELLPTPAPFRVVLTPPSAPRAVPAVDPLDASPPSDATPPASVVVDSRTLVTERPPRPARPPTRDRGPLLMAAVVIPLGIAFVLLSTRPTRTAPAPESAPTETIAVAPAPSPPAADTNERATATAPPPPSPIPIEPAGARATPEAPPMPVTTTVPVAAIAPLAAAATTATAAAAVPVVRAAARPSPKTPTKPAPAPVSAPVAAAPTSSDPAVGFQIARRNHAGVRDCWLDSAKTTSLVTVNVSVDPGGSVSSANAAAADGALARCVEGKVRSWSFPAAANARSFHIPIRLGRN